MVIMKLMNIFGVTPLLQDLEIKSKGRTELWWIFPTWVNLGRSQTESNLPKLLLTCLLRKFKSSHPTYCSQNHAATSWGFMTYSLGSKYFSLKGTSKEDHWERFTSSRNQHKQTNNKSLPFYAYFYLSIANIYFPQKLNYLDFTISTLVLHWNCLFGVSFSWEIVNPLKTMILSY